MTTTQINLDDQALAEAAEILGTSTKVDTVNTALRLVSARQKQLDAFLRAHREGTFKNSPIADEAWQ